MVRSMSRSVPSNATKEMLVWGRKKAGLSIGDVAQAEKVPADRVAAWERGEGTPSFAVLRRLARRYKRPVMVFYLPEPPKDFSVVKDFRLLGTDAPRKLSPELLYAMRLAQERQSWASQRLQDEAVGMSSLVGALTGSADIRKEAHRLRRHLF